MEMTQKRMTVGILAHVDAGKTTLAKEFYISQERSVPLEG